MEALVAPARYAVGPTPLATALVGVFLLCLGTHVLARERRSRTAVSFLGVCVAASVWLLASAAMYAARDEAAALAWARATFLGVPFIAPAVYAFATDVLGIRRQRRAVRWTAFGLAAVAAGLLVGTDVLVDGVRRFEWGFFPRYRLRAVAFVLPFVFLLGAALWELRRDRTRAEEGTARLRARAFGFALGVAYVALADFLPGFGLPLYPIGFLPVAAFLLLSAAAIRRHRLVDLSPAFVADRLVETLPDLLAVVDAGNRIRTVNPALRETLGYAPGELEGRPVRRLAETEQTEAALAAAIHEDVAKDREMRFRTARGEGVEVSVATAGLRDQNDFRVGTLIVARDVRRRKELERTLRQKALFDGLTGLPNRARLTDHIERALARSRRDLETFALLYLDLDGFHLVNDSLGHPRGDRLLADVGRRLLLLVREVDTVARIGGDQFAVLLRRTEDAGQALRAADRIQLGLVAAFEVEGQPVHLTAGIGVVLSAPGYATAEEVLRDAHAAMCRAKSRGVNQVAVFESAIREEAVDRLRLQTELRNALERQELRLAWQPIVRLDDGRPLAWEALLRWRHPERGVLLPDEFLRLMEDTRLSLPIGDWVAREACRQLAVWREAFPGFGPAPAHVNVSAAEVGDPGIVGRLGEAVREAGLEASDLAIEVTETAAMANPEQAARTLAVLRERGHRVCVDDFGTGYSSLSWLRRLPVNVLKVDRSFVSGAEGRRGRVDARIVQAIVSLAEGLGLEVIAEGIETPEQAAELAALGCWVGQGHHYARPLDPAEVPGWAREAVAATCYTAIAGTEH